ncbi:MAG: TonB-dependent receptor plug domain-containing protein [Flammeovirgaceae bacterium]|jgi:iron complex outermembrane receptor protein|nr:TonB-dependent receptor plug domain-containing protein [Flammeovirgaceae bacterium]
MRVFIFGVFFLASLLARAQRGDTIRNLQEVIVQAFASEKPLEQVAASVAIVNAKELNRFNNTSLLPALNAIAGVRMEERSPGSFRLAIRGSSLRSPFGVRNVKFYWNGLPLTDGGGNTYLNLLDFNSVSQIEVIKGPSGSLYGAGMGGVLLLNSSVPTKNEIQLSAVVGSYGLQRYQLRATAAERKVKATIQYAHQQADGYRQQTAMRRDALNLELQVQLASKTILRSTSFYTDLFYQTPGALTKAQYDQDPRQARLATATLLSAIDQQAAIYNQTFYSGAMLDHQWNNNWSTTVGFFGSVTDFKNPAITNYEKRRENNWGGRMENQLSFKLSSAKGKLTFGGELQFFNSPITNYDNLQGVTGNLQFSDELKSSLATVFAQSEFDLPNNLYLTVGASGNFISYQFNRTSTIPAIQQIRSFEPVLIPRVALLKKWSERLFTYGSISKGFSPPTLAEVRPSTNTYNDSLRAETGINYELGARGTLVKNFSFDVVLFSLQQNETIVVQRQINGSDFFVNAGGTSQLGAEVMVSYLKELKGSPLSSIKIWTSYTRNNFQFNTYVKNQQNYSHRNLTGTAPVVLVSGFDLKSKVGFYLNSTFNYVDTIPLNDANTDFAASYYLIGSRLGWASTVKKMPIDIWLGIDNATDQTYSLGNDLNATGGRYYNAAARRNWYVGFTFRFL